MDFVADTEDVARILSGIAAMKAIKIIKIL